MLGKPLVSFGTLTVTALSVLLLIAARPAQAQTENVLYNFTGGDDGGGPYAGLISDGAGDFYGTTPFGGLGGQFNGHGIVFKLSANNTGGWRETVLYRFKDVYKRQPSERPAECGTNIGWKGGLFL